MKRLLILSFFGSFATQVLGQGFQPPFVHDTVPTAKEQINSKVMLQGGFKLLGILNEGEDLDLHQIEEVWDKYYHDYDSYKDQNKVNSEYNDSIFEALVDIPITEQPPPPPPLHRLRMGHEMGLGELILFVDTTQSVSIPDYTESSSADLENGISDFETYYSNQIHFLMKYHRPKEERVKAFPLFIYNSTDSLFKLDTQEGWIYIIQEAKDEKGKWKPIEFWDYYVVCGNSLNSKELLPSQIAVSKIYRYDGDFETQVRVKLMTNGLIFYSKEFRGKINRSQLDLPKKLKEESIEQRKARFFKK